MCEDRYSKRVLVKIPEDLSCTSYARFKYTAIDACIAPIVEALQKGGNGILVSYFLGSFTSADYGQFINQLTVELYLWEKI